MLQGGSVRECEPTSIQMKSLIKRPSNKHVQFNPVTKVMQIERVRPEEGPNVYGSTRHRSPVTISTLYELNLVKLLMEVHPQSRANTQYHTLGDPTLEQQLILDCIRAEYYNL